LVYPSLNAPALVVTRTGGVTFRRRRLQLGLAPDVYAEAHDKKCDEDVLGDNEGKNGGDRAETDEPASNQDRE
jgi:hypothetical protein